MAPDISFAPSMEASIADFPSFLKLIYILYHYYGLSTSIPTPKARPANDMIFMVTPVKYIMAMAKLSL